MIIKETTLDTEHQPHDRVVEMCLNCGKGWVAHHGWRCMPFDSTKPKSKRSNVPTDRQYLTHDMVTTLAKNGPHSSLVSLINSLKQLKPKKAKVSTPNYDISDWKVWRDTGKDNSMCCGGTTVRAVCTYHGPSTVAAHTKGG